MKEGHTHSTHARPTHFTHAQHTVCDNKSAMLLGLLRVREAREKSELLTLEVRCRVSVGLVVH